MQNYIPVWVAIIGAVGLIVPSILSFLSLRASQRNAAKIEAAAFQTAVLAKNIDGAMTEIKQTIAAKNLAEGKLEGIAGERDRGSPQMDKIEAVVIESAAAAVVVAGDLAERTKAADASDSTEAGAAADAAASSPNKVIEDLKK